MTGSLIRVGFFIVFLACAGGHGFGKTAIFETVTDDDARTISALVSVRIERLIPLSKTVVMSPNLLVEDAALLSDALSRRLQNHGFKVADQADPGDQPVTVALTVVALPHGVWVRVFTDGNPLFLFFVRGQGGLLELYKEDPK